MEAGVVCRIGGDAGGLVDGWDGSGDRYIHY